VRTNLVNKKTGDGLLLNVDKIAAEHKVAVALLFAVDSHANGAHIRPERIFPAIAQEKLVYKRMEIKAHVAIIESSKVV